MTRVRYRNTFVVGRSDAPVPRPPSPVPRPPSPSPVALSAALWRSTSAVVVSCLPVGSTFASGEVPLSPSGSEEVEMCRLPSEPAPPSLDVSKVSDDEIVVWLDVAQPLHEVRLSWVLASDVGWRAWSEILQVDAGSSVGVSVHLPPDVMEGAKTAQLHGTWVGLSADGEVVVSRAVPSVALLDIGESPLGLAREVNTPLGRIQLRRGGFTSPIARDQVVDEVFDELD